MSSSSPSSSSSSSSSTPLHPIPTHSRPLTLAIRIAHPLALAALFLSTFRSLVADPPAAMRQTLPLTVAVQVVYAITCLPPAGTNSSSSNSSSGNGGSGAATTKSAKRAKQQPGAGAKKADTSNHPSVVVTALVALILSLLVAPGLHALLVLFGAPLLDLAPHTALLAAHGSVLALFPTIYARGIDARSWRAVAAFAAPVDEVFGGLAGAAAGAWLGAVPIPLDWDREWQRWPVTVLVGMGAGYVLGKAIGGTVAYGRTFGRLRIDEAAAKGDKKE